jgi:hypothetical protein
MTMANLALASDNIPRQNCQHPWSHSSANFTVSCQFRTTVPVLSFLRWMWGSDLIRRGKAVTGRGYTSACAVGQCNMKCVRDHMHAALHRPRRRAQRLSQSSRLINLTGPPIEIGFAVTAMPRDASKISTHPYSLKYTDTRRGLARGGARMCRSSHTPMPSKSSNERHPQTPSHMRRCLPTRSTSDTLQRSHTRADAFEIDQRTMSFSALTHAPMLSKSPNE